MSNFHKENVRLQEAMNADIHKHTGRVWQTPGAQIECDELPKDAHVISTFVMNMTEEKWIVGLQWENKKESSIIFTGVAEFSTLEKLQNTYPQLFELEGTMFTLS